MAVPGGSDSKESACNAEDPGLNPGSRRSPGEDNVYPLQYSCLQNSMERGAWQATVHGVTESRTQLRDEHCLSYCYLKQILIDGPHSTIAI